MPDLHRAVLALVCLKLLLFTGTARPIRSLQRRCPLGDCLTYGGPNKSFSVAVSVPNANGHEGGWIVGEIRTFAFGADNAALVQSLGRNGWVECAGQRIDAKGFPEAVAVLQETWGSENVDKTEVYLPDLRGLTLRGWQHNRRAPRKYPFSPYTGDTDLQSRLFPRPELMDRPDPGIAGTTDPHTKQPLRDHVGTIQPEQFHGHRHDFTFTAGNGSLQIENGGSSPISASGEPVRTGSVTGFSGGNETHPPNAYVLYLIYLGRAAYEAPISEQDLRSDKPRTIQAIKNQ